MVINGSELKASVLHYVMCIFFFVTMTMTSFFSHHVFCKIFSKLQLGLLCTNVFLYFCHAAFMLCKLPT